jgi:Zn-dependent peptidase ImmA (M78 family)
MPTILVNVQSRWNRGPRGRNATLAHELCHLLLDRDRARRAVVVSGPWAPPRIEQRARAFAAMFLVPVGGLRRLVEAHGGPVDADLLRTIAGHFNASTDLVATHLLNLSDVLGIARDEIEGLLTDRLDGISQEGSDAGS